MKLYELTNKIEKFYPLNLAEEWDNVGIQIGSREKEINNILTALEITDEIIEEAIEKNVDLIVVHHPLIFKKIENLKYENFQNKLIINLIKNDIAVYVAHTNLDIAKNGMNDWLCELLEIKNPRVLSPTKTINKIKCKIEISAEYIDQLINLLENYGIGRNDRGEDNFVMFPKIKHYKNVMLEKTVENDIVCLETVITEEVLGLLKKELYLLKKNQKINTHLELYKISNIEDIYGIGRYGYGLKALSLEELGEKIKKLFDLNSIKIVGSREKIIKKIAIVGGSGKSYIEEAAHKHCDVLITGDIGFHDAQYAKALGIALIDPGHYIEIIFNDAMQNFLSYFDKINVFASEVDSNPFEEI